MSNFPPPLSRTQRYTAVVVVLAVGALIAGLLLGSSSENEGAKPPPRGAAVEAPQLVEVAPAVRATYTRKGGFPPAADLRKLLDRKRAPAVQVKRLGDNTVRLCEPAGQTFSCVAFAGNRPPIFVAADDAAVARKQVAVQLKSTARQR